MLTGAEVGNPAYLTAETVTFGSFVLLSIESDTTDLHHFQSIFWNLCLVSCAEDDGASEKLLAKSIVSIES